MSLHIQRLRAFVLGALQFRSAVTPHFSDYDVLLAYDRGRELAHKATGRRFEQ